MKIGIGLDFFFLSCMLFISIIFMILMVFTGIEDYDKSNDDKGEILYGKKFMLLGA